MEQEHVKERIVRLRLKAMELEADVASAGSAADKDALLAEARREMERIRSLRVLVDPDTGVTVRCDCESRLVGWRVVLSSRIRRSVGRCVYSKKTIELSWNAYRFPENRPHMLNTVRHEAAHALLPAGVGHSETWAAMHRALGGDGMRTCSLPKRARFMSKRERQLIAIEELVRGGKSTLALIKSLRMVSQEGF